MAPGDLCTLLHNWLLGPGLGESPHVFEVPGREALHAGEFPAEVLGQAVDDLGPPAVFLLAGEDVAADLPVEETSSRLTASAARSWAVGSAP